MPGGLSAALKTNAKRVLRGKWGKAIGIMVISGIVCAFLVTMQFVLDKFYNQPLTLLPADISFSDLLSAMGPFLIFSSMLSLLAWLLSPLTLGIKGWYARLVYERETPVGSIFSFFERGRFYARALWYSINLGVRTSLWAILLFTLPSAAAACMIVFSSSSNLFVLMVFLTSALTIVMLLLYCVLLSRYSLAPYLLTIDDSLTANQAIKLSVVYTRGFRLEIFLFRLSFIGWMLCSLLLIPMFYTVPYMNASMAMMSRYVIEYNERRTDLPKTEDLALEENDKADEGASSDT